jgi:5-methylcytosine-specific restriction endonuclease McrA
MSHTIRFLSPGVFVQTSEKDEEERVLDTFYKSIEGPSKIHLEQINTLREKVQESRWKASTRIPKQRRGEVWKSQFGTSTEGSCFCCRKRMDVFDTWEAGHIIAHSRGGSIDADNLRPVCGSCNKSMGDENMLEFKARCYPN